MQHYEKSADFFKGEESNSSANKCMLKVKVFFLLSLHRAVKKFNTFQKI